MFDDDQSAEVRAEIEDRDALRRVAGLSTELTDVTEVEYRQLRLERVILVGVWTQGSADAVQRSLAELARLAETAGSEVLEGFIQRRDKPDPATYIGSGKAKELTETVAALGADTVICDGELSPSQLQKLEKIVGVKVVDRTWLILDIFAQHASSREGKAQVALAQMAYMLPRLRGWGDAMSRQAGGIGTRGPGETKIETDRRRIRTRMAKLRRELKEMTKSREVTRSARRQSSAPSVVIVGYTNAGKSSLLNRLTKSTVLVQNELFATVDPTVRRLAMPSGRDITIADTVGFVSHLPHQLVESFRSTLEEAADADLLVHVVDGSDPNPQEQISAVREVLKQIEAADIPELVVINKCDIAEPAELIALTHEIDDLVEVSAVTGTGIDVLLGRIDELLPSPQVEVDVLLPYTQGSLVARIHREGEVISLEHGPDGYQLHARVDDDIADQVNAAIDESGQGETSVIDS